MLGRTIWGRESDDHVGNFLAGRGYEPFFVKKISPEHELPAFTRILRNRFTRIGSRARLKKRLSLFSHLTAGSQFHQSLKTFAFCLRRQVTPLVRPRLKILGKRRTRVIMWRLAGDLRFANRNVDETHRYPDRGW